MLEPQEAQKIVNEGLRKNLRYQEIALLLEPEEGQEFDRHCLALDSLLKDLSQFSSKGNYFFWMVCGFLLLSLVNFILDIRTNAFGPLSALLIISSVHLLYYSKQVWSISNEVKELKNKKVEIINQAIERSKNSEL